MPFEFSKESQFLGFVAGTTGAAATVSGPIFDMTGFESAYAAAYTEVSATASRLTFEVGSATNAMGPTTGLVEMSQGSAFMNQVRPGKRYGQFKLNTTGGGANAVLGTWLYNARNKPTSNTTAVVGGSFYTPTTGTPTT